MTDDPLEHRKTAARMANRSREAGLPSEWYEPFYQWAEQDESRIPWADLAPHPLLVDWITGRTLGSVAVVGCGLGDDAEALRAISQSVWAFDVSPTAIEWADRRFSGSAVEYEVADIFALDPRRFGLFDVVVESYTLQALPPEYRLDAQEAIAKLLKPGGELVVISRWRAPDSELGPIPWPLTEAEFSVFDNLGLTRIEQTIADPGEPIRLVWKKEAP